MPNIFDVAKRAGVSIATVSRVLTQPDVVAPTTRRKVMAAVERLGYTPNASAKNLRVRSTRRLIATVPHITRLVWSTILLGIQDLANREGYAVLLGDTRFDRSREERYAQMFKERQADGLIFLGHHVGDGIAGIVHRHRETVAPIVNVMGFRPRLDIPSIQIDNVAAAADAMDHLYDLGHTRVGLVTGGSPSFVTGERLRGALARARKAGAERDLIVEHGDFSVESGVACAERLLARPNPPTAIFCFNDEMALGVVNAARRRNLRIPDDLSVVGIDDIHHASFWDPPLTTVALPMRDMGEEAVRVLLGILNGGERPPQRIVLPHTLVVRSSTAAPGRAVPIARVEAARAGRRGRPTAT
ncbi:MAG TPA: LacI family DNA-binding transcriptional regulator [Vicinamibacterales bacterium]|nr:LacI family DNA-binding transcriptional regulator [Vicinamibacterales bacterium]